MGLDRARTEVSVQYVDHNLLQADEKNAEDHAFLRSACRRFGLWYSKPGNGVSHPTHMQRFGAPGKTMVGSDSHTRGLRSLGHARHRRRRPRGGAGHRREAAAPSGCPRSGACELTGELPPWCSAKDVDPRDAAPPRRQGRHRTGSSSTTGPALATLTAMDRHVIANMGAELGRDDHGVPRRRRGARASCAREEPRGRLHRAARRGRRRRTTSPRDRPLGARAADRAAVVAGQRRAGPGGGRDAGRPGGDRVVGQPGAAGLRDRRPRWSTAARPTTASASTSTRRRGRSSPTSPDGRGTIRADHAPAPASTSPAAWAASGWARPRPPGTNSLRTFPRNFPGRSGAGKDDQVWLCSPETAAASAR